MKSAAVKLLDMVRFDEIPVGSYFRYGGEVAFKRDENGARFFEKVGNRHQYRYRSIDKEAFVRTL